MKKLITTSTNESGEIIVSGRELHEFLEVKTQYTKWFERMVGYGFTENMDFVAISQKRLTVQGNETTYIDHALKLDMAKEVSMIQRNEKGKQARQYFIEVEKAYKQQPQSSLELALQAALKHEQELKVIKSDVDYLKGSMRIDSLQQLEIKELAQQSVIQALGGKESNAYKSNSVRAKTFHELWGGFNRYFKIPRYSDLPKSKFDEALRYIGVCRPSTLLQMEIDKCNAQMVWGE